MLEEKIYEDYLKALKERDKHRTDFLSFIRAELKNSAIELRKEKLEDNEVLSVLNKQRKRLEETKQDISTSGRADLIESADKELSLLHQYLPQPLTEKELSEIIERVISQTGAASIKDMGKVMKDVLAQTGVRADSKKVSDLARNKLAGA